MSDDRAEMQAARLAGLQKRHEQRLENATYTAAEVKVLTEAALRLGRKEALDEAAAKAEVIAEEHQRKAVQHRDLSDRVTPKGQRHFRTACAFRDKADGAWEVAHAVRELADVTNGRTEPGMDSGLPPDKQAVRKRYPHAHACVTCSPDGRQPGPGCINCRNTGWDQTPCQTEGHKPQCPHDCCDPNIPKEGA